MSRELGEPLNYLLLACSSVQKSPSPLKCREVIDKNDSEYTWTVFTAKAHYNKNVIRM